MCIYDQDFLAVSNSELEVELELELEFGLEFGLKLEFRIGIEGVK